MKLLLDIGNSRIKWAQVADGKGWVAGEVPHDGRPANCLDQIPVPAPKAVLVSQLDGDDGEQNLRAAMQTRWPGEPFFARSQAECLGLKSAYTEPRRLGVDRWLAMLGAWQQEKKAAVVADAGTALTVDVIDGAGQHLGGIIAPGLKVARDSLLNATSFPVRSHRWQAPQRLGDDTESAVDAGVLAACLGAIEHTASAAPAGATLLLTGGDAARLKPMLSKHWQVKLNLVMQGLLAQFEAVRGSDAPNQSRGG
ncbi:MAG: type III pantothenate kinase [Panacagrimonas sp.]